MPHPSRLVRTTTASLAVVLVAAALSACAGSGTPVQAAGTPGPSPLSSPAPDRRSTVADQDPVLDRPAAPSTTVPVAPGLAKPVRVAVPSVGIDAELIPLGLEADGSLEVPSDFGTAGWYVDGPEPGEPGPAVIAGHVDSHTGPAVFFRLRDVQPGATVDVTLADGAIQRFTVDAVERHPKGAFPTERVYGPTEGPTLRLVTCGGPFDREARSYLDNVVVFGTPVPTGPVAPGSG